MEPKNSNSIQLEDAAAAVQLCHVAIDHHPVKDIGRLMPGWKIVWSGGEPTDPNYAFVAVDHTGKNYALTIRGSVSSNGFFSDWDAFVNWALEDLDVALAYWPFASGTKMPCVSAGAYIAFTNMLYMQNTLGSKQLLLDFLLANTVGGDKRLIITGHSLGGNMANVYASYYAEMLKQKKMSTENIHLITFAAPASGNSDFANDLDTKFSSASHYQNSNDIVPNFPVESKLFDTGSLYSPAPAASAIKVHFTQPNQPEQQISLEEVFEALALLFAPLDYQQPKRAYIKFSAKLDPNVEKNTIQDWLKQAGIQHQLFNYANYLGVKLPPLEKPVVHAV